jgi:hypothetical protein
VSRLRGPPGQPSGAAVSALQCACALADLDSRTGHRRATLLVRRSCRDHCRAARVRGEERPTADVHRPAAEAAWVAQLQQDGGRVRLLRRRSGGGGFPAAGTRMDTRPGARGAAGLDDRARPGRRSTTTGGTRATTTPGRGCAVLRHLVSRAHRRRAAAQLAARGDPRRALRVGRRERTAPDKLRLAERRPDRPPTDDRARPARVRNLVGCARDRRLSNRGVAAGQRNRHSRRCVLGPTHTDDRLGNSTGRTPAASTPAPPPSRACSAPGRRRCSRLGCRSAATAGSPSRSSTRSASGRPNMVARPAAPTGSAPIRTATGPARTRSTGTSQAGKLHCSQRSPHTRQHTSPRRLFTNRKAQTNRQAPNLTSSTALAAGDQVARRRIRSSERFGPGQCSRRMLSSLARTKLRRTTAVMIRSSSWPTTGMKSGTRSSGNDR